VRKNRKTVYKILFIWTIIGLVLLIVISVCNDWDNNFFQKVINKGVWAYVFGSCILSGIVARLRQNT